MKTISAKTTKTQPRRQKFVRAGKNPSGNKPYHGKIYQVQAVNKSKLDAASPQVKAIVGFMAKTHIKARGGDIIKAAKKAGALKTKIKDPRVLFGYLAKEIQACGAKAQYE